MAMNRTPYGDPFLPGDLVQVVGGTFVGMTGKVVSRQEAKVVQQTSGGEVGPLNDPYGCVWVVLSIFGRPASILLHHTQLRRGD